MSLLTCRRCKEKFDSKTTDYIKDKTGNIHTKCYTELALKRGEHMVEINEQVNTYKEQMEEKKRQQELKKLERALSEKTKQDKNNFYDYIQQQYDISVFHKSFFTKVANINNGTHHQVNEPISYEDLLYIFKRKAGYLYKVHMKNETMGTTLVGMNRLNYDLAVVLNLYDEYKQWKRKQAVLEAQNEVDKKQAENTVKIDYTKIIKNNKNKQEDDGDILDILDDLY